MFKKLAVDVYWFTQIVIYWPFVLVVMMPLQFIDKRLGTQLNRPLIRLIKVIANP